jgi:hypothetical protein
VLPVRRFQEIDDFLPCQRPAQYFVEPLLDVPSVPGCPFGVGSIYLDQDLMMGCPCLMKHP